MREAHKRVEPALEPVAGNPDHEVACLLDAARAAAVGELRQASSEARQGVAEERAPATCDPATAGAPRHRRPSEPSMEVRDLVKHFPMTKGIVFSKRRSARCARSTACRSTSCAARRSAWSASRAAASRPPRALLLRLIDPTRGSVKIDGRGDRGRISGSELKALRREMQMIFQDPYSSLNPRKTVGSIISEPFVDPRDARRARASARSACRS